MVVKPAFAVIFVSFLAFTSAASAEQSAPATIDLQKTCRVTEKAVASVFGDAIANVYDRCVENETAARQQLVKDWSTYSVADRAICIQPRSYQPSYTEWLTCTEMQRDVRKLRKTAAETPTAGTLGQLPAPRTGAAAKRCPIVQYGPDGGMVSAIACSLH
jgi:hypothetical protein